MPLFTTLSRVMKQQGDKLSVNIETLTGGDNPTLRLVITPRLTPVSDQATEQEVAYRNAARLPLIVSGTAGECEEQLDRHIGTYQRHLDDAKESIQRMEASRNKAENTTSDTQGREGGTSEVTSKNEKPEPSRAATPDSTDADSTSPRGIGGF